MGRNSFCARSASGRLLLSLILVSLALVPANHLDKSSVEASSPEDKLQQSLPGFAPSTELQSPSSLTSPAAGEDPKNIPQTQSFPLITPNVFPYQSNPIAAVVAASLTLAVVSLKETGRIDINGILWLLNSSDYYAGVIGSIVNSYTQQKASAAIASAVAQGIKKSPVVIKPIFDNQATRVFGNIVNGITYTMAVSSGFEVFSQFWKYSTKNIPEVRSLSGLLKTSGAKRKQVLNNLLYYCLQDANMQKRILNSVYNHRIMTYEFIATNVAMYIGAQVGAILAKRYGPSNPFFQRIAPVLGSISGGLIVQAVPDSWKEGVNRRLLEYKISNARENLRASIAKVDDYIKQRVYPAEGREFAGFLMSGMSLSADIDRIFRARDMLNSLEYQKMISDEHPQTLFGEMRSDQSLLSNSLMAIHQDLEASRSLTRTEQINQWVREKKTPEEITALARNLGPHDPLREQYRILISAAMDRVNSRTAELEGLLSTLEHSETPKIDPNEVIFDMATSNR